MQLTEEQIKEIREEAEKRYPYFFDEGEEGYTAERRERKAYIVGATSQRERVKPLLEAAKELDEYLSETLYEKGKPVHLNYVGAFSILHKKIKQALSHSIIK